MGSDGKLRFAPLIRVSTEAQEERGVSLALQTEKAQKWVAEMGGVIPKHCWAYTAQEHATPDSERKILDRLLEDAPKGKFNAVIVADVTRWARDNLKSEQGLKVLQDHGIRFFVSSMEINLRDPVQRFFLTNNVALGVMQSSLMAQRSVDAKIKKARAGEPSTGSLPYGRTWDERMKKWGVDADKQRMIQTAAERFLEGATMLSLERETGLSGRKLYKLFGGAAGDTWTLKFKGTGRPAEEITQKVPPLLSADMMRKLAKRLRRGREFYMSNRGREKFLFNGVMFCAECGYARTGGAIGTKATRYYIHAATSGKTRIPCDNNRYLQADLIEGQIMRELQEFFGDRVRREKALLKAQSGLGKAKKIREQIRELKLELDKVLKAQKRAVEAYTDPEKPLLKHVFEERARKLEAQEKEINAHIRELDERVQETPTLEEIKAVASAFNPKRPSKAGMEEQIQWSHLGSKAHFDKMTFEEKRELLRLLFGSSDRVPVAMARKRRGEKQPKFVKHGIYVKQTREGSWHYELKGLIPTFSGILQTSNPIKYQSPSFSRRSC